MKSALSGSLFVCLIASIPWPASGQQSAVPAEDAKIRKSVDEFVQAFNRGDAATIADQWTEDAEYTTPDGEKHAKKVESCVNLMA